MKYIILFEDFDPFAHLSKSDDTHDEKKQKDKFVLGFTIGGNEKIKNPYLSLPAGYTCPFAKSCKTMAIEDPITGKAKIKDFGEFRCYAAYDEVRRPNLRRRNWSNLNLLNSQETKENMVRLIKKSFEYHFGDNPPRYFRIHESGDFFSQKYFDAWLEYAKTHTETIFYAFTTSLKFWVNRLNEIPNNLRLTASKGGTLDHLIEKHHLRWCTIAISVEDAIEKRLQIDINDKLSSSNSKEPFCILIHGGQKKGSDLAKNVTQNRLLVNKIKKQGLS